MKKLIVATILLLAGATVSARTSVQDWDKLAQEVGNNTQSAKKKSKNRFGVWSKSNKAKHIGLKSKANASVAQALCKVMKSSKNFKSLYGSNMCGDCSCQNGVMKCSCSRRLPGPVVRFEPVTKSLDFKEPANHPVIFVEQDGSMSSMSLLEFEKKKAQQESIESKYPYQKIFIKRR